MKNLFLSLGILLVLTACNEKARDLTQTPGGQAPGASGTNSNYPHSAQFKVTKEHGVEYRAQPDNCKTCHGSDLSGGVAKVNCTTCHKNYPHTEEFKRTAVHATSYFANRASCNQCHDISATAQAMSASATGVAACTNCHQYPHPIKWGAKENHGAAFLASFQGTSNDEAQASTCLRCHGETSPLKDQYPEYFVSCGSCHMILPHVGSTGDWLMADHYEETKKYGNTCTGCHKINDPTPEERCTMCHAGKKPTVTWEDIPAPELKLK